jgi:hypothetical protein
MSGKSNNTPISLAIRDYINSTCNTLEDVPYPTTPHRRSLCQLPPHHEAAHQPRCRPDHGLRHWRQCLFHLLRLQMQRFQDRPAGRLRDECSLRYLPRSIPVHGRLLQRLPPSPSKHSSFLNRFPPCISKGPGKAESADIFPSIVPQCPGFH